MKNFLESFKYLKAYTSTGNTNLGISNDNLIIDILLCKWLKYKKSSNIIGEYKIRKSLIIDWRIFSEKVDFLVFFWG